MAKISIKEEGRSGKVQYIEGTLFKKNTCEFYWEFGGANVVAMIWFPKDDAAWDKTYPWAAGRRMAIVQDMAEQVRKQQVPSSHFRVDEGTVLLVSG